MRIILREAVRNLGKIGDLIDVKSGYGRNFLIPTRKAVMANKANIKMMEEAKSATEQENAKRVEAAVLLSSNLKEHHIILIKQSGDDGKLFGSIGARDISKALSESGFDVHRSCVSMNDPIRYLGEYFVRLDLYHGVSTQLHTYVLRSESELKNYTQTDEKDSKSEEVSTEDTSATDVNSQVNESSAENDQDFDVPSDY